MGTIADMMLKPEKKKKKEPRRNPMLFTPPQPASHSLLQSSALYPFRDQPDQSNHERINAHHHPIH